MAASAKSKGKSKSKTKVSRAKSSGGGGGGLAFGGLSGAGVAAVAAVLAALAIGGLFTAPQMKVPSASVPRQRAAPPADGAVETRSYSSDDPDAPFLHKAGARFLGRIQDDGALEAMLQSLREGEPFETGFAVHAVPSIRAIVREQVQQGGVASLVGDELEAAFLAQAEAIKGALAADEGAAGDAERWHALVAEAGLAEAAARCGLRGCEDAVDDWLDHQEDGADRHVLGAEGLASRQVILTAARTATQDLYEGLLPNFGPDADRRNELRIDRKVKQPSSEAQP